MILQKELQLQYSELKEEIGKLQRKVNEQDEKLTSCLSQQQQQKVLSTNNEIASDVRSLTRSVAKSSLPRTCNEARLADPTLANGIYWVDPDGQGVGDDPIQVYCDMSKGKFLNLFCIMNLNYFIYIL